MNPARGIALILLFVIVLPVQSCMPSMVREVAHDPPLGVNVQRIEKGRTTKAEVFAILGVPDFEAHGSRLIIHEDAPINRWFTDMRNKQKEMIREYQPDAVWDDDAPDFPDLIAYSSLDDDHIALFYSEMRNDFSGGKGSFRKNKLLIFINKRTGLVSEISYLEQFKPEAR